MKIGEVDVQVEGAGDESIVMVHGWPDTARLWDGTVAALQDRYRCIRFTLPGFDRAHARRARTLGELTDFLRDVVEQLSPGRPVTLLLHDWGCPIGYEFYRRHPQLVARIIGIDIGDTASLGRTLGVKEKLMVFSYQVFLATAWRLGGAVGDRMTRWMAARMRCPSDPAPMGAHMAYPYYMTWFGGAQSWRRELHAFEPAVPMLYVYGRRKPLMFHAQSWLDALQAKAGNAVVAFDTGHWVMSAAPAQFHQTVRNWLAGA